jgi:hypothetical protein
MTTDQPQEDPLADRRENPWRTEDPALDPTEKWGQGTDESHPTPVPETRDAGPVAPLDADAEAEVAEERELVGEDVPGELRRKPEDPRRDRT